MKGTPMSETILLEKVTDVLQHLGIDLDKPVVDLNWGNSCFMQGPFESYSINALVKFWADKNDKKVTWVGEFYN